MFGVITLSTKSNTLIKFIEFAELNRSWKYCSATWAIWSSMVHQAPSLSVTPKMLFFRWRWLARWWKYLVFLSLAGNHIDQYLCRQKSSSWWRMVLISIFKVLIMGRCLTLFCNVIPSNIDCFSCSVVLKFPKMVLLQSTKASLHLYIFSKGRNIGLSLRTPSSQAPQMIIS